MDKDLTLDEALFWAGSIDHKKYDVYFKIYGENKVQLIVEDLYIISPYTKS